MISSALDYTKASSLSLFTEVGLPFFFVFFSSEDFLENRKSPADFDSFLPTPDVFLM